MVIHLLSPQCFPTTEPPDTDLSSVLRLWPCYQPPLPFRVTEVKQPSIDQNHGSGGRGARMLLTFLSGRGTGERSYFFVFVFVFCFVGREAVTVTGRMDKSTCLEESDQQSSKLCSKICT